MVRFIEWKSLQKYHGVTLWGSFAPELNAPCEETVCCSSPLLYHCIYVKSPVVVVVVVVVVYRIDQVYSFFQHWCPNFHKVAEQDSAEEDVVNSPLALPAEDAEEEVCNL